MVIWGQCSEALQAKLESLDKYETMCNTSNCPELLKALQGIMYKFESQRYVVVSLDDAQTQYFNIRQAADELLADYFKRFKNCVQVLKHFGGTVCAFDTKMIKAIASHEDSLPVSTDAPARRKAPRGCTLAVALIKRADPMRFGNFWVDLANGFALGDIK